MVIRAAAEHPGYSAFDRARFLDEPAKRGGRTEFARDRARIIHFQEPDFRTHLSALKLDVS
jgi:dGTPase